ncbi:unnamed protein product [Boreogadus saida]
MWKRCAEIRERGLSWFLTRWMPSLKGRKQYERIWGEKWAGPGRSRSIRPLSDGASRGGAPPTQTICRRRVGVRANGDGEAVFIREFSLIRRDHLPEDFLQDTHPPQKAEDPVEFDRALI